MAGQFDEFYLPFDSTGTAVTNYIADVRHTIASVGNKDYQQIAPRYGLFFGKDLAIKHVESNTVLEEGTDYYLSYYAKWFKQKFNDDVFGSIVILNKNITGNIGISARYVGGDFARPLDGLIPELISEQETENVVFWDQIIDPPTEYHPTTHTVSTEELTSGFDDMVEVLWAINASIIQLGEIPDPIDISLVTGLEDALLRKQDNNVYSQLNKGFLKLGDPAYVSITLPKPDAAGLWTIDISLSAPAGRSSAEGNPLIAGDAIKIAIIGQIEPTGSLATWQNAYAFIRNSVKVIPIYLEYTAAADPIIYLDVRELFVNKELVEFDTGTYIKEATINIDRATFANTNPDRVGLFDQPFLVEQLITLPATTTPITAYLDNSHRHTSSQIDGLDDILTDLASRITFSVINDPAYGTVTPLVEDRGYIFDCKVSSYAPVLPTTDVDGNPIQNGTVIAIGILDVCNEDFSVAVTPAAGVHVNGLEEPMTITSPYCTIWFSYLTETRSWRTVAAIGENNVQAIIEATVFANMITDHSDLEGLDSDDHTQYALADGSRGAFETQGAVANHENDDDPHPQYLLPQEVPGTINLFLTETNSEVDGAYYTLSKNPSETEAEIFADNVRAAGVVIKGFLSDYVIDTVATDTLIGKISLKCKATLENYTNVIFKVYRYTTTKGTLLGSSAPVFVPIVVDYVTADITLTGLNDLVAGDRLYIEIYAYGGATNNNDCWFYVGGDFHSNFRLRGHGNNVGTGVKIYKGAIGDISQFKTILAGENISITEDGDTITITSSITTELLHSALQGLEADDHEQYALADGSRGSFEAEGAVEAHVNEEDPHSQYLQVNELVPGDNITLDTTTTPGSVIISATAEDTIKNHSELEGLENDDHQQYALADGSRGNFEAPGAAAAAMQSHVESQDPHSQYLQPNEIVAGNNITIDTTTTPGSIIITSTAETTAADHSELENLGADDHQQYALADGSRGNFEAAGVMETHLNEQDPHSQYLLPSELVAGDNVTLDTTTQPGSIIINAEATDAVKDHGGLQGLEDDDHQQYALADGSRGNFEPTGAVVAHVNEEDPHSQYLLSTEIIAGDNIALDTTTTPGSIIISSTAETAAADHGSLSGLENDDHAQYALADGSRGNFEAAGAVGNHESATNPHAQYALAETAVTGGENAEGGTGIFNGVVDNIMKFKSIVAGENITIVAENDILTINSELYTQLDHSTLENLEADDHQQYALADGSRGNFETAGAGQAAVDTHKQDADAHPTYLTPEEIPGMFNLFFTGDTSTVNSAYKVATITPKNTAEIELINSNVGTSPEAPIEFLSDTTITTPFPYNDLSGHVMVYGKTFDNAVSVRAAIVRLTAGGTKEVLGQSAYQTMPTVKTAMILPITLTNLNTLVVGDRLIIQIILESSNTDFAGGSIYVGGITRTRFTAMLPSSSEIDSAITAHEETANPHTQYVLPEEIPGTINLLLTGDTSVTDAAYFDASKKPSATEVVLYSENMLNTGYTIKEFLTNYTLAETLPTKMTGKMHLYGKCNAVGSVVKVNVYRYTTMKAELLGSTGELAIPIELTDMVLPINLDLTPTVVGDRILIELKTRQVSGATSTLDSWFHVGGNSRTRLTLSTLATNLGDGVGIYKETVNDIAQFKSLVGGENVDIRTDDETITIDVHSDIQIDHGSLAGLNDNDHPQYLLRSDYEIDRQSNRNISKRKTLAVNEVLTLGINNSTYTATASVYKLGAPLSNQKINLLRDVYDVTPAAYGNDQIPVIPEWSLPKDQFDVLDFQITIPAESFGNIYPDTTNTSWTEYNGWTIVGENLHANHPSTAKLNDGSESWSNGFVGWAKTGVQRLIINMPDFAFVNGIYISGMFNTASGAAGLRLLAETGTGEVVIKNFGEIYADRITFNPIECISIILEHDSLYGNRDSNYGMAMTEIHEIMAAFIEYAPVALIQDGDTYYAITETGLVSLGTTPDWGQAISVGTIDNAWLTTLTTPVLVFNNVSDLQITYNEIVPQIAIQVHPIALGSISNITEKTFTYNTPVEPALATAEPTSETIYLNADVSAIDATCFTASKTATATENVQTLSSSAAGAVIKTFITDYTIDPLNILPPTEVFGTVRIKAKSAYDLSYFVVVKVYRYTTVKEDLLGVSESFTTMIELATHDLKFPNINLELLQPGDRLLFEVFADTNNTQTSSTTYYWGGTHDTKATFETYVGINLAMSTDRYNWFVWDGTAFVSIGNLLADTTSANLLFNEGMSKSVYDSIPIGDYNAFVADKAELYFAYSTNLPDVAITEHSMIGNLPAPFAPHTAGTINIFPDMVTYTANVAGDFLLVVSS